MIKTIQNDKTFSHHDRLKPFDLPSNDFKWKQAWNGVRALMRCKEDTRHVFTVMKALRGNSIERGYRRFASLQTGRRILETGEDLIDILKDKSWLVSLPDGSLGRVYLDFMIRENITAEGLAQASADAAYKLDHEGVVLFGNRLRDQHDLWHVLTGHGRDGVGEACMTAFSYAQTKNLGFAAIAIMAGWTFSREFKRQGVLKAVFQAYRNGLKAEWLPGQDWKHLLTLPIGDVRTKLNIGIPYHYQNATHAVKGTGIDYTPKSA